MGRVERLRSRYSEPPPNVALAHRSAPRATQGLGVGSRICEVGGIGGHFNLALEESAPAFVRLAVPIPLRYAVLEGKVAACAGGEGYVPRLASHCVELAVDAALKPMANLKMNLASASEALAARDFYGKVIRTPVGSAAPGVVRLTSVPPEVDALLEALRRYGTAPS